MAWLRYFTLPAIVGAILVGFSFVNRPEESLFDKLVAARAAAAQEGIAAASSPVATLTDTSMQLPTPQQAASPAAAPDVSPTVDPNAVPSEIAATATATGVTVTVTPGSATATSVPPAPTQSPDSSGKVQPTAAPSVTLTPTGSIAPVITPTVDPSLPPLSTYMGQEGLLADVAIPVAGGRIASSDGRVTIDFPAGTSAKDLQVKITRRSMTDVQPPSPDRPFVGLWEFDAADPSAADAPVHQFDKSLTVTVHFGANDLIGRDTRNLVVWTRPDDLAPWKAVPASVNAAAGVVIARMNHFSQTAITASRVVDTAPLLDGRNFDPHSGAAALSIPIALPPGHGGLAPQLSLNYNSGRLGEMKGYTSLGSWVGTGWDLDVPNIQFSQDPQYSPGNYHTRAFLSLNGVAGGMAWSPEART